MGRYRKFIVGLGPILLAWLSLQRELGAGWWRTRYRKPQSFREMLKFGFSTNLSATIKLLVSESGLRVASDVVRVQRAGARAVLVGEHLLRKRNLKQAVRRLMGRAWASS